LLKLIQLSFWAKHRLKPPSKPRIVIKNTEIAYKTEVKFLGMHITENLNWQTHIYHLCRSLSKDYYRIKSLKNTLSNQMLWNTYFAYFQLRLRYGIFWGGSKESIKILRIQKKVMRLMTGLKKCETCKQKFKENRILTVTSLSFKSFMLHKEVQGKFDAKLYDT